MRSALLAVLTRLLFPLEDEDLGVQHEHFRQRLFELPAEVHALAHRIDPQLGNRLDPLFAMDHEGERPEGVTLAVGTVAGRLAATAAGGRWSRETSCRLRRRRRLAGGPAGEGLILFCMSVYTQIDSKSKRLSRKPKKMRRSRVAFP